MLLLLFISISCSRKCDCPAPQIPYYKAEVIDPLDIDCGRTAIAIDPEDTTAVKAISGSWSTKYVLDQRLPDDLNIVGKKILLIVRKLEPGEHYTCATGAPIYPRLKLIHARAR